MIRGIATVEDRSVFVSFTNGAIMVGAWLEQRTPTARNKNHATMTHAYFGFSDYKSAFELYKELGDGCPNLVMVIRKAKRLSTTFELKIRLTSNKMRGYVEAFSKFILGVGEKPDPIVTEMVIENPEIAAEPTFTNPDIQGFADDLDALATEPATKQMSFIDQQLAKATAKSETKQPQTANLVMKNNIAHMRTSSGVLVRID